MLYFKYKLLLISVFNNIFSFLNKHEYENELWYYNTRFLKYTGIILYLI